MLGAELKFEKSHTMGIPQNWTIHRAKVPGGWIVLTGEGVAFLPDTTHRWDGGSAL
jgi:hypothetical protein